MVLLLLGIGGAALLLSDGLSFGGTGTCVYVYEGNYHRYYDYTEAECDAYCKDVRYGSCYWEG